MAAPLVPMFLLVWIDHNSDEDWGIMCEPPVKHGVGDIRRAGHIDPSVCRSRHPDGKLVITSNRRERQEGKTCVKK
jgi:hypothetical protein